MDKMKYGENYKHGEGKLKGKAMKKGGMKYEKKMSYGGAKGSQDVDAVGKKKPMKHETNETNMPSYKINKNKHKGYGKKKGATELDLKTLKAKK